jgi:hypothetical protein
MHNITERDRQIGVKQAWHGLTEVVKNIDVGDNYLTEWDVERKPLTYIDANNDEVDTGFGILVGSDDDKIIGRPMSPSYRPITNERFMDLVSDAVRRLPKARIESMGSVCNRGKVFVTVRLDEHSKYKVGDREFNDFLNFGNSHDQTSKLWVNNTNICTVCDNTFSFNLNSKDGQIGSAVHRGDVEVKLANIANLVDSYLGTQEDFRKKFERLIAKKIDSNKAKQLFTGFLNRNNPREGVSTRCLNTVENLDNLFKRGAGNRGESYADVFSAVTDYYTHNSTRGNGANKRNQYVSSEFGLGRMNKQSFWTVINNDSLVDSTIIKGEKLLSVISK